MAPSNRSTKREESLARALAVSARLGDLLRERGIPIAAGSLAKCLRAEAVTVHPHTLLELLAGRRSVRRSTLQAVLDGLKAAPEERRLVWEAWSGHAGSDSTEGVVSILEALGGLDAVDRGRDHEEVTWRYLVGRTDAEDRCIELRRTHVGGDELRLATFGPGEFGRTTFVLLDLPNLDVQVHAQFIDRTTHAASAVRTAVHLVEVEPARHGYRIVVQFSPPVVNADLAWVASFRWPGLWRSLRGKGLATGRLQFRGKHPKVTKTTVELIAPVDLLPDMELRPATHTGRLQRSVSKGELTVRWVVDRPPDEVRFEVHAPSRRPQADA